MSYQRQQPLSGIGTVADAALAIVKDPCLFKVSNQVIELRDLEAKSTTGQPAPSGQPGIGLCKAVKPLEYAIYVRKNPWLLPVGGAVVVGGLIMLGYWLAK